MIPRLYEPIANYLESVGATEIRLQHGGKHKKLQFMWQDRRYTATLPSSPSDTNWLAVKLRDLRHLLGRPDAIATDATPKRSLQDMTNELQALAPSASAVVGASISIPTEQQISQTVQVAYYKNGDFRVAIPRDSALHREVEGKYYQLEWLTGLRYKIKPASEGGARVYDSGSKTVYFAFRPRHGSAHISPFASIDTLFRLHDGCLLFELPAERSAPRVAPTTAAKTKAAAPVATSPIDIPETARWVPWTPNMIRQVLQQVRAIEAATAYRLQRGTDGILRFIVDTIE